MKNLAKFGLIAALCGLFAACGSDSGTSSNGENSNVIPDSDRGSSFKYGSMTDSRDGKTYKTVTIGEQTWMAENLNYAYNESTATEDSSSFCYNNEPDSCSKYGRLYLWSAAMDSAAVFSTGGKGCGYYVNCTASGTVRGICPDGWHLPDTTEWRTLFTAIGGTDSAGTMLKSTSGWNNDGNGEDSFGFSVLPAGYRFDYGGFDYAGYYAYFWSSTVSNSYNAYRWNFYYDYAFFFEGYNYKDYAFSVRCVRN